MSRQRYSPRFSGIGKQFLEQAVNKNLVKVLLTPALRAKIKEEFDCTDDDIDKAVQQGITEFGDDFRQLMVRQREQMKPSPEIIEEETRLANEQSEEENDQNG